MSANIEIASVDVRKSMGESLTPEALSDDNALIQGNRKAVTDHYIEKNIEDKPTEYRFTLFTRLNAKKVSFKNINFSHCIFDGCYLNHCVFDSCDFNGCRFISCNFYQSSFAGCKFEYATFERTQLDDDILDNEAPWQENLCMRFARSLRMNYQQIGDAKAVNKAISLELKATSTYLLKSWKSKETYYKHKYPGFKKIRQFFLWCEFWILDFIWGNGESILKLLRTMSLTILLTWVFNTLSLPTYTLKSILDSLVNSVGVFLGVAPTTNYSILTLALLTAIKLIIFSLLTAILVKRFGRR